MLCTDDAKDFPFLPTFKVLSDKTLVLFKLASWYCSICKPTCFYRKSCVWFRVRDWAVAGICHWLFWKGEYTQDPHMWLAQFERQQVYPKLWKRSIGMCCHVNLLEQATNQSCDFLFFHNKELKKSNYLIQLFLAVCCWILLAPL